MFLVVLFDYFGSVYFRILRFGFVFISDRLGLFIFRVRLVRFGFGFKVFRS